MRSCASASVRICSITSPISPVRPAATATDTSTPSSSRLPSVTRGRLTGTQLFDARFGFDHILAGKVPPYLGGPSMEQLYGIPGLPTSPTLTGGLNSQSISGFSQLGRQTSNPQFQNPTSFNPKLNYSWIKRPPLNQDRATSSSASGPKCWT